uniref:Uncharacterized protein n=1 Tax=Janibacter limosus TaxID=53458 RepID=A0AC61U4X3_9MICO|nr:hypothetical protein [Janibacter limosus]
MRTWLTHRPSRWSSLVPVIALGAGLLFATSGTTARGTDLRSEATGLPDVIRERTIDNERDGQRVDTLRGEVDRLTRDAAPGSSRLQKISRQSQASSRDAGLTPVKGPAVTVALDDADLAASEVPEGFTVDDVVVHQQDVQGRRQRPVARRCRGDADHGPAGHLHQCGPMRRQHPDPPGSRVLAALHDHRHRRPRGAAVGPRRGPRGRHLPAVRRRGRLRATR